MADKPQDRDEVLKLTRAEAELLIEELELDIAPSDFDRAADLKLAVADALYPIQPDQEGSDTGVKPESLKATVKYKATVSLRGNPERTVEFECCEGDDITAAVITAYNAEMGITKSEHRHVISIHQNE